MTPMTRPGGAGTKGRRQTRRHGGQGYGRTRNSELGTNGRVARRERGAERIDISRSEMTTGKLGTPCVTAEPEPKAGGKHGGTEDTDLEELGMRNAEQGEEREDERREGASAGKPRA
jgi:hypothetical protein